MKIVFAHSCPRLMLSNIAEIFSLGQSVCTVRMRPIGGKHGEDIHLAAVEINQEFCCIIRNETNKFREKGMFKASFIAIKLTRTLSTVSLLENAKIFVVIDSERQNNIIGVKKYPFPGDVSSKVAIANNDISSFVVQENALKKGFLLTEALEPTDGDVQRMPDLSEQRNTELQAMDCPRLLRNDLVELFPTIDLSTRPMSVINWTEKTKSDMSSWSMTMEVERLQLTGAFIERAKRICESLNAAGHWADFIDPSSGKPYLSGHTNATLVDTDHRYNDLGFIVTDLGCCKVLEHLEWGSSVFVGTIFTDAPTNSNIVKQIVFTSDKN